MRKCSLTSLTALGVFAVLFGAGLAVAQEKDAENCKDHPLLSRMKNFTISQCKANFDSADIYVTASETKTVEGQKTVIDYALQEGSPSPSYLQIRRNYGAAIKSLGGTVLYDESRYVSGKVVKNGKEAWISVEGFNEGGDYTLTIVEVEAMAQEVTAGEMLNALNKDGFIALYINFDTGKSDIKPESESTIVQIAALLKDNPGLKVSIEGHTDNVGTPASNKTLSEARAKSVMAAVVKGGVDASRLSAIGWGQEKPVADNRSEEGRAKNRRVEIVKK
jgi:outer membrane protein OmpA-like peptidoglycan-associated protein